MDLLRSCYKSKMRLFPDRPDILVEGQWRFCLPDAKPVPWMHSFASHTGDPDGFEEPLTLGETQERGPWVRGGTDGRYKGQRVCGSEKVWQNGVDFADRGQPKYEVDGMPRCCCPPSGDCGPAPQLSIGGQAEGAISIQRAGTEEVSIGKQAESARSTQGSFVKQYAIAGQVEHATSSAIFEARQQAKAAQVESGVAEQLPAGGTFAQGGQAEGAQSASLFVSVQQGIAAQAEGGASIVVGVIDQFSRGGQAEGAETDDTFRSTMDGVAAEAQGGKSTAYAMPVVALGGMEAGGSTEAFYAVIETSGGTVASGSTDWSQYALTATGGVVTAGTGVLPVPNVISKDGVAASGQYTISH